MTRQPEDVEALLDGQDQGDEQLDEDGPVPIACT
jgi:hypothetical protein